MIALFWMNTYGSRLLIAVALGRQYEFKNIGLLIMLSGLEMLKPCSWSSRWRAIELLKPSWSLSLNSWGLCLKMVKVALFSYCYNLYSSACKLKQLNTTSGNVLRASVHFWISLRAIIFIYWVQIKCWTSRSWHGRFSWVFHDLWVQYVLKQVFP